MGSYDDIFRINNSASSIYQAIALLINANSLYILIVERNWVRIMQVHWVALTSSLVANVMN